MIFGKINLIILTIMIFPIITIAGQIAFVSSESGNWELFVMDANGKNKKQLTNTVEDERWPDFSPDGKKIVFGNNRGQLLTINVDGTDMKKISMKPGNFAKPVWSPDNKRILYSSIISIKPEDSNMCVIPIENNEFLSEREIIFEKGIENNGSFSPDGKKIIYSLFMPPRAGFLKEDLMIFDLEKRIFKKIISDGFDNLSANWALNNSKIVYVSNKTGSYQIWSMDPDGSNQKQLTDSLSYSGSPYFSPDCKEIVFVSNRTAGEQLWIMNSDGSNQKQITFPPGDARDPVWK